MEPYILPISWEQICNAKHWMQDVTHGYKEAIRTKMIKQDPGLNMACRMLNRNKDALEGNKLHTKLLSRKDFFPRLPLSFKDHMLQTNYYSKYIHTL